MAKSHLNFDPQQEVGRPYVADPKGSFVLEDTADSVQIVLLKSSKPQTLNGKVWFGPKTAGPPGHVHGGCQAAVLDEMMGSAGWYCNYKVVAGEIKIHFMKMIPLEKEYHLRAKIVKTQNRKIFIQAEIFEGETVFASSEGTFIQLTDEQLAGLDQARKKSSKN